MAHQFIMPHLCLKCQQCPTMSEGGIVSWKVKPGDTFSAGDPILEVETDKATIDVEAADDGKLWEILVNEGTSEYQLVSQLPF